MGVWSHFLPERLFGCGVGYGHSDAASLVTDFVLGDAGVAARLAVDAVRLLGFGGGAAQARTHKLLASIAAHTARLRIAVFHSLLLRAELGAGGHC